ncbi:g188 [Yersinia phage phiR1-37]|nr:hypothetical protein phiR1-37_gp188 [Yersinia phage phiR1-37]CCE26212.1 g188 [Yersinia phage phiR1-37]
MATKKLGVKRWELIAVSVILFASMFMCN